jgi:hypothetical protein
VVRELHLYRGGRNSDPQFFWPLKWDIMITSIVYPTYRAIERPIEFKGFAGQYIVFAALSLIGVLLLFVILYIFRVPPWLCVLTAFGLGAGSLFAIGWLSRRFGAHGLEEWMAARRLPKTIRLERNIDLINEQSNDYGTQK